MQGKASLWIKVAAILVLGVLYAVLWWRQLAIERPRRACLATAGAVWEARTRSCRLPPQAQCEKGGGWWEPYSKTCAKVISVPAFTGKAAH